MASQTHESFSHSNVSSAISDDGDFDNFGSATYPPYEVGYLERGRRPKFSGQELEALVSGVEANKDIILPPNGMASYQGSLSSSAARQNSWKEILAKVNAVSEVKRSLPEVVKRWRYLKSRTRVKARRLTKWDKPLSELQKRILDTVGDIETPSNGDKESNEQYEEDGWDEVYEVDVTDVDEVHNEEDAIVVYEHQSGQTANPTSEARPQTGNITSSSVVTRSSSSRTILPSATSSNPPLTTVYSTGQPTDVLGERHRLADGPATQYTRSGGSLRRAPQVNQIHTGTNQAYDSFRAPSISERFPDKNNVNITVQSCTCRHDNPKKSVEEERLEIEKERLAVEKERLAVEKQRLELEKERLQMLKTNSETQAS